MPSGFLYGWDESGNDWVKVECNADGKLHVDATLILENPPTEDEASKAPTSEWAFDHAANESAHHSKYTDVNSRAAIGGLFDANGIVLKEINFYFKGLQKLAYFQMRRTAADLKYHAIIKYANDTSMYFQCEEFGVGLINWDMKIHNGSEWQIVIRQDNFQAEFILYLEDSPTDGELEKAPTSNWAYDHANADDAHHAKYTDLEAQTAVNLNGDLYLSLPGLSFVPKYPHTDAHQYFPDGSMRIEAAGIDVRCAIILPEGCTVTAVIVDGDAGAASQTWTMVRVLRDGRSSSNMATATVQTEDTSISFGTIDNITYLYLITCLGLTTNDVIYNARIKYTL